MIKKDIYSWLREIITKLLIYFIISTVIFYPFHPKFFVYIFFMISIWIILKMNYKINNNNQFFLGAILLSIANFASLIFSKYFIHNSIHINKLNITISIIYFLGLSFFLYKCIYNIRTNKVSTPHNTPLFNQRKYDLNRVQNFIESTDIIGINGMWGSGKSFLVAQLKKHINTSNTYAFIDIDLLTCNLDELQTILFNEMEKILYEHRIIPTHSTKLKKMFNESAVYNFLYTLIMKDDSSYSETLNGFMQEINLLEKTIVIIYEDIDRIANVDTIKKIFSISEKLANNNIKVIYQYEEANLKNLGLDREFLEKYIPHVVNLTPIPFMEILGSILNNYETDKTLLNVEDFTHLSLPIYLDYYLKQTLKISYNASINLENKPTRKVKIFVDDLRILVKTHEIFKQKEYKKLAINFLFIKHFFHEFYNQINIGESLMDTIKFCYNDKAYTILELVALMKLYEKNKSEEVLIPYDLTSLFNDKCNQERLALLSLFDYSFEIESIQKSYQEIISESPKNISNKVSNERKDRLIWNLLFSGKSEYTDYEIATKKLITDVLSKPKSDQKSAYESFSNDMYHNKYDKKDNKTIFRLGIPEFISLSQALSVSNITNDNWKDFLNFYFYYTERNIIDIDVIQVLNYCNLTSKEVYLYILNKFNQLDIIGNMNSIASYRNFLKKYLRAMSSLEYVNTPEIWRLDLPEDMLLDLFVIEDAVKYIKKDIITMKNKINIKVIQTELNTLMEFINKNISIVSSNKDLNISNPKIHTEISSHYPNQEEFNRLSKLKQTVGIKEFEDVVEKSYINGYISVYEVDKLL